MASKKYLVPIDLNNLEIQNVSLQNLTSDPSPVDGKIYFNTSLGKIRVYDGDKWNSLEDSGSLSGIVGITGTAPITSTVVGNTATVGISAATTSAPGSMSAADKTKLDNATSANTSGRLVMRDSSGNFSAGTITADLVGSASQLDGQTGAHYLNRANHTGTQTASTISNLKNTVISYRLDEFAAPTSDLNLNTHRITGLGEPTQATDAATKGYVDAARSGLDAKQSVRVATTGNISLSGTQSVDGVELSVGDRVLVKNQTTASANGIYLVASAAWTRAPDANSNTLVSSGMFTFVEEGTTNASTGWVLSTSNPIDLGVTDLDFVQFSEAGAVEAGNGLTKTGTVMSAVGTANRIVVGASGINIASNYVGQTSITTLGTITTGTWQGTTIAANQGGTGLSSYTSGNFLRAASATTLEQRTPAQVRSDIGAVASNPAITAGTATKITYDSKGLVIAGDDLVADDIPNLPASKINSGTFDIARIPTITVAKGGTGLTSVAAGSFLRGNGTSAMQVRTPSEVKADIGLGAVENVAISGWTGSSNLTTVGTITTGTWNATTIALNRGGTGATTAVAARTNLGATGKFAMDVGNGTATSVTVTHNLNSMDVTVDVYDSTTGDTVECSVTRTSANVVTLGFAVAPATNEFRVVVVG